MRQAADAAAVRRLLAELGRLARSRATVYLAGGATAVLEGRRQATIDVDLRLEPESDDLLRLLPELKERLDINIELATPLDFLPEPKDWRERSPFVSQEGPLTVRHIEPTLQALAKIERGLGQDLADVDAMLERGLTDPARIWRVFDEIEPRLYRFPAIDAAAFRAAIERAVGRV